MYFVNSEKKIITMNDLNDIKTYFNERGKKNRNNLKLMDIISRLKNTISNYDIEQKTKKNNAVEFDF